MADKPVYTAWKREGSKWQVAKPVKSLGDLLKRYGYTVYYIGNEDHMNHEPPEDHTPFSRTGWPVTSPYGWVFAMDIMPPPTGSGLPSLQQLGAQLLADRKMGYGPAGAMKYMNWEPDRDNGGRCYQERFMPGYVQRASGDRGHIHYSGRSDMAFSTIANEYDPVARIRAGQTGGGERMTPDQEKWLNTINGRVYSLLAGEESVSWGLAKSEPNWLVRTIRGMATTLASVNAIVGQIHTKVMADESAEIPAIEVDATMVAAALGADEQFLDRLANRVADKMAERMQS